MMQFQNIQPLDTSNWYLTTNRYTSGSTQYKDIILVMNTPTVLEYYTLSGNYSKSLIPGEALNVSATVYSRRPASTYVKVTIYITDSQGNRTTWSLSA